MGVFGPKYAPQLQPVINHAERFCEILAQIAEHDGASGAEHGWLVGRRQEVETVLELVVRDWAADRIALEEVTRAVTAYLDELHAGAEKCLGLGPALECCAEDEALTASLAREHEAVTRPGVERAFRQDAGETWFDPSALLDVREPPVAAPEASARAGDSGAPVLQEGAAQEKGNEVVGKSGPQPLESARGAMRALAVLILLVLSLSGLWASTQYVAAHLHYAPQLGPPWVVLGELRVYPPWGWVQWGRLYQARAPTLFYNAEGITTLGALAGAALVVGAALRRKSSGLSTAHAGPRLAARPIPTGGSAPRIPKDPQWRQGAGILGRWPRSCRGQTETPEARPQVASFQPVGSPFPSPHPNASPMWPGQLCA
jgi:hypothetical protein